MKKKGDGGVRDEDRRQHSENEQQNEERGVPLPLPLMLEEIQRILGEFHFGSRSLFRRFDLPKLRGLKLELIRDHVSGKSLPRVVVNHNRIVEGLAGKSNSIFRGTELLRKLLHILIGFEVGIGFGNRKEFRKDSGKCCFGTTQMLNGRWITRICRSPLRRG